MARRITNEDLVLNLILNADDVEKGNNKLLMELHKLDSETRDLQNRYEQLRLKEKQLIKEGGKQAKGLKVVRTEMKALKKQIEANHIQMNQWRKQIGLAGLTINQMRSQLSALKIQLHNATDPTVLKRLRTQIRQTELRIERLTTGMTRAAQAWRRLGTVANQFGTVVSWLAIGLFGLVQGISSTVRNMRQLDSQFSSVMKTTDLTRGEVAKLKQEFDQLNADEGMRTPTATKELLEIARIAGRLGIRGVEDIRDFTLAVDKLYVALGDDLSGGVEEITEQVGKLVNVFQLAGKEGLTQSEALLRVGSVLNELGKSSEANAQNILNFTSRMGGVGSMANFTIDQLAGIAAALDATGVKSERGSTAMVKLINGLGENVEKFSRILGISVDQYAKWAEEDINGLLIAMLEATSAGNTSILEVTESMGDMEVTGVRVAEVFGKLTQNIDKVKEQQLIAARAFESSASVMNEYYIITKDWDSLMALQGKRLKSLADDYSKSMTPALYEVYRGMVDFLFAIRDGIVWLGEHSRLIAGMVALYTAFKSAKIVNTISNIVLAIRVEIAHRRRLLKLQLANNVAIGNMRTAYAAAGGGVRGLTAALRTLWGVMWANPVTAVTALVLAAAGAFLIFSRRSREMSKAISEINAEIDRQATGMNLLFDAVKNSNEGSKKRKDLIKEINELYGQYLPHLLSEKSGIEEIETAQNRANQALRTEIALKMKREKLDKLGEKYIKKSQKNISRFLLNPGLGIEDQDVLGKMMADFEAMQTEAVKFYTENEKWNEKLIDSFYKKHEKVLWQYGPVLSRNIIKDILGENLEYQQEINKFNDFTDSYLERVREIAEEKEKDSKTPGPMLDEKGFEAAKAAAEMARDEQKLALMQMGLDKEEYRKRELKLEEEYLRKMLELTRQRYTSTAGDPIGGAKEILDAQIALQQNLNAQAEDGGEKRVETQKDEMLAMEVQLLEMLEKREITQSQFDSLMLQMQEDYYARMIAKLRSEGESTLEWEKKWYENRLKQQKEYQKQQKILREAMAFAYDLPEEEENEDLDEWAEQYQKRRARIRQFLQLESGDNEGLESEFAVFETNDYEAQLKQLEDWYNEDITRYTEYQRRKTEIQREQSRARLKMSQQVIGAVNDLLGAQANLYAAQKDAELEKAGNNEAKKFAIQKKYAKKEQDIAVAQALISGAMSIMRIWEAKATGNAIADTIIKGVLTAAMVATTATQIAAIKAQQFAKGSYPVVGADDGRTYNAEYVGTPKTGVYKKPSLGLFAEKPEMVIDYPTLRNIQFNNPALIDAIMAHRKEAPSNSSPVGGGGQGVPQYAEGNWPAGGGVSNADMAELIRENTKAMQELKNLKVVAAIETIEREREKYMKIKQTTGL